MTRPTLPPPPLPQTAALQPTQERLQTALSDLGTEIAQQREYRMREAEGQQTLKTKIEARVF